MKYIISLAVVGGFVSIWVGLLTIKYAQTTAQGDLKAQRERIGRRLTLAGVCCFLLAAVLAAIPT